MRDVFVTSYKDYVLVCNWTYKRLSIIDCDTLQLLYNVNYENDCLSHVDLIQQLKDVCDRFSVVWGCYYV